MSDFKMKQEIKNLIKMGFNEDMATLIVATKYGNHELASDIVSSFAEENEAIKQELEKFKPFVPEDTSGIIILPSDESSSSAEIYPLEYLDINDNSDNIILSSNSIEERNDKNEIENI
jgi:hypothetical protein